MDISMYIDDVREQLARLTSLTQDLAQAVTGSATWAYYWQDGEEAIGPEQSATRIAEYLLAWDYPDSTPEEGRAPRPQVVGYASVSEEALAIAGALNAQKAAWIQLHQEIRAEAAKDAMSAHNQDTGEVWATKQMRRALKLAGRPNLDLDATDRRIPLLPGPAYRINFHRARSAASRSRTIADVIEVLETLVQKSDDATRDNAQAEIQRLGRLDPETPVAYRAKRAVASARYRASYWREGVKQPALTNYASNPVLFPHGGPEPRLVVFASSHTTPGAGRPSTVSSDRVSPLLGEYFWYMDPPAPAPTAQKVADARPHNPFAKTDYPGLWLGVRKAKSGLAPMVRAKISDTNNTSFSIKRLGLQAAWRCAAEQYCEFRGVPLQPVLNAIPDHHQVDQMMAWAESHR